MASVLRTSRLLSKGQWRNFNTAPAAATKTATPTLATPSGIITTGAKSLANYPSTKVTTLANGLRVATEQYPGQQVAVSVNIDAGSRYENAKNNGVAHFIEHLLFKGTNRRTRLGLEQEIEDFGGSLNAFTSRENVNVYAKVLNKDLPVAVDWLSDVLLHSKFDEAAIENEKGTILREMQEVNSIHEEVLFDRLHETAFRGTALARTILGPEENISAMDRQTILDYISTHYTGNRMIVTAVGDVNHDQFVKLVAEHFGTVASTSSNGKQPFMEPAQFTGSDIRVRFDSMPEAYVAYAFPIAGVNDADTIPLLLIHTMLGQYDKYVPGAEHHPSPLVSNLAKENVSRYTKPFITQYKDTGLFGVHAAVHQYDMEALMYLITETMTSFSYEVDEDHLQQAKNHLKMSVLLPLDGGVSAVAEEVSRQLMGHGRRIHPSEMLARIDAVDAKAVKECAQRYFYDQDFALSAIGPIWELPDYNWHRRRTAWLRY